MCADLLDIPGVGPANARRLERLGIRSVRDLLWHLPRTYRERRAGTAADLPSDGEWVSLCGRIASVRARPTRRPGLYLVQAELADGTGCVDLVWFLSGPRPGRPPRPPVREGAEVVATGQVRRAGGRPQLQPVEVEPAAPSRAAGWAGRGDGQSAQLPALPVYPLTEGLTQRQLSRWIVWALERALPEEWLSEARRERLGLPTLAEALRAVHAPPDPASLERARRRLALEELVAHAVQALAARRGGREREAVALRVAGVSPEAYLARLPFTPTDAQRRAIALLADELSGRRPMRRLLLGDVGSGKTVVAAYGALRAVRAGYQAAVIAPTRILAEQHRRTLEQLLGPWGVAVDLYHAELPAGERARVAERLEAGLPALVVGTQALLGDEPRFGALAFAVLDEEHRFGVEQRRRAADKGPLHLLAMSATPIPRTLALFLYADLDVTFLEGKPPGRSPVDTRWIHPSRRRELYAFVRREVERSRQAYVIFPRVEEEEREGEAAVQAAERLAKGELRGIPIGLMHGRQSAAEQERQMAAFQSGKTRVLVATTVVEVGVDVPNATVMVIEGAERFGLAQLHQLRGRVGRGSHQGYCLLVADPQTESAKARIRALREHDDGFAIAELDLALRGAGELFGERQAGAPGFKAARPERDGDLMQAARTLAEEILSGAAAGGSAAWYA